MTWVDGVNTGDYAKLIGATEPGPVLLRPYGDDISPTTDDRPFFFHTTKLKDQFQVAFGRSMLFGNGLSALMTLTRDLGGARGAVRRRSSGRRRRQPLPRGWFGWLVVLRRARRRLHADRGVGAAAVRAAARPSGVLADRDAVLAAARHRPRRRMEPSFRATRRSPDRRPWRSSLVAARRRVRHRRGHAGDQLGDSVCARRRGSPSPSVCCCRSGCAWAFRCRPGFGSFRRGRRRW